MVFAYAICIAALFLQTISAQCKGPMAEALPKNMAYGPIMPYGPIPEALTTSTNMAYGPIMPYGPISETLANMPTNLPYGPIMPYGPMPEAMSNLANNLAYTMPPASIQETTYIPENAAVFNGGGFQVTSFSNVGPTGIKVQSDNLAVEGPLSVTGKLPFLGVVTIEGPLPAVGQGAVAYECGNGNVGIVSEGVQSLGNELGLTAGLAGLGCNGVGNGLPVPVGRY